jgi:hypothetical protein
VWIAATDPSILELAKWGPAGIVILGFVSGWLWAKPAVERLQKDLDRALADLREVRKEQRELEAAQREIVIPAIIRFVEIGEKLQEQLEER